MTTLTAAQSTVPASVSRSVSYSKVENVVYAPTNPVATKSLQKGSTDSRSAAKVEKNPRMKQP